MSTRATKEFLVGLLVLSALILMLVFGWMMGAFRSWSGAAEYKVRYAFAGGAEVGSPVRVSGVKVGRVDKIIFLPQADSKESVELVITVSRDALPAVRKDSKFYINMAGIIGERYLEISPGSAEVLPSGSVVRGEDPPRIDQLLSQGYGLFGKIQEVLEENEVVLTDALTAWKSFVKEADKFFSSGKNRQKFFSLLENLEVISTDIKSVTGNLRKDETQKLLDQLGDIIRRAHQVDEKALKKFLQQEGIRSRIF